MLEVEPTTGQRGHRTPTESGRHCNEAVPGAASEAFVRWLRHRRVLSKCHQRGNICKGPRWYFEVLNRLGDLVLWLFNNLHPQSHYNLLDTSITSC